MAICSVCAGKASYLLNGRWYCQNCMQTVLGNPAPLPLPPKEKVSFLDEKGHLIRAPFCSICNDRIATFIVGGTAVCMDCSRAGREWPEEPDRDEDGPDIPEKPKRPNMGACIVDFPSEYVCVDVETTGRSPSEDEIIEIAARHVKDGAVRDTFKYLVKPSCSHVPWTYEEIQKRGYKSFSDVPRSVFEDDSNRKILPDEIVNLTGITDDMLVDAPAIGEVIPKFYKFAGDHILVGHNAIFDMNFLYDACLQCGFLLQNNYVDTLRIARNLLPDLAHYNLASLARELGITQDKAHRAAADADVTWACLEAMKARVLQTQTIPEYISGFVDPPRKHMPYSKRQAYDRKHFRPADLVQPDSVDLSHPLCGKAVVFTGELSMDRATAAQMAVDVGAVVRTKVSRKTNFLVVGRQDPALVDESGHSGNEKIAREINDMGKGHIQILSEQEFMELVQQKTEAGVL